MDQISRWLAIATLLLFIAGLSPELGRSVVFLPQTILPPDARSTQTSSLEVLLTGLDSALPEACKAPLLSTAPAKAPEELHGCVGEAVAGATFRVYLNNGGSFFPVGSTVSDEAGKARLDDLPLGDYWILIEANGRARRSMAVSLSGEALTVRLVLEPASHVAVRAVDESGKPIAEATVLVSGVDPLPFGALTDGGGKARFDRLGPGPWQVNVNARGYEPVTRADVSSDLQVTLHPLSALLVHVLDLEGHAAPGATVMIVGANLWPARQATTNTEGEARIGGLATGVYDLRAQAGDRVSMTDLGVMVERGAQKEVTLRLVPGRYVTVLVVDGEEEGASEIADADVILVENGISPFPHQGRTDRSGRVTLGPIPSGAALIAANAEGFVGRSAVAVPANLEGPLRVALRHGGTVVGEVVDRNGHSIDGASLEVVGTDLDGLPIAESPFSIAARRGHFAAAMPAPTPLVAAGDLGVIPGPIPGVPGGTVAPPDIPSAIELPTTTDQWVSGVEGDFKLYPVTPGRIRVLAHHPTYIEAQSAVLTLEPGGEVSVKIVMLEGASLQGRVVDEVGRSVANARVELSSVLGSSKSSTFTLGDGTFTFAAVPGEVLLSLARPENPGQFVVRKTLHLKNEERGEIELVLPAERDPVTVTISGDRQSIEAAQVTAISLDPEVPLRQTAFTDARGQVTFTDAVGLPLRIQVEAAGFGKYQKSFEHAAAEIAVELSVGILVQGSVTAVRGRQSLTGAQVTAVAEGERHMTQTDARGTYQFTDLNPGQVTLIVSHPDYATAQRVVELSPTGRSDRAFDVDPIDLSEAGGIRGTVVDNAGNPVSGARVGLGVAPASLPAGNLPAGIALTNVRGEFELSHLEPGRVSVSAYAANVGRGTAEGIDVRAGDVTADVRIILVGSGPDTESDTRSGIAATLGEVTAGGTERIIVLQVAAGSEAERSDLKVGDVIVKVDGEVVDSVRGALARLGGPENSDVLIEAQRGEGTVRLRVRRQQLRP